MRLMRVLSYFCLWNIAIYATDAACADSLTNKVLRIVVTAPGGSLDLTARLIAPKLADYLGQQVIVENRSGVIGLELVARAPPDGHILLLAGPSLWLTPFLRLSATWDPLKDFSPVVTISTFPNIVIVHPSLPVKSIRELIALARLKPGQLNYSSGQQGSSSHLAGEYFKSLARIQITHVPYKSAGPAMLALLTGESEVSFPNAATALPFVRQNKLRALAVTTIRPSALVPDLPTVHETGLPGYESTSILGIFSPARTPEVIVARLNREIVRILNDSEIKRRIFESGAEVVGSSPSELMESVKEDMARTGKLISSLGIRSDY